MGRRGLEVVLLNVACAFLSCHADVGNYEMELKSTPQSTSFLQRTTSAQSVSPYQITSSSHVVTTLFSSRTSNIITTSLSQRTSALTATQTTNHHPVTTALAPNMTTQARENNTQLTSKTTHLILTTTIAGKKTTAKPPLPTNETTTHVRVTTTAQTSNKTTIQRTEKTTLPTNQTTHSRVATTTATPTSPTNQTTTLAVTTTATTKKTAVKTTTQPTKQTTHTAAKTTARTNMTTLPPGNQTTRPATTATVGPTVAPDPSSPTTGAYNVSNGSVNCIKASMGLELIVQNSKTQKKGYFNIDPSITQTSGSCGNLQSNLNLTFNGGFISFTFVKKDRVYYISTVEASLKIPSVGSWHSVTSKQLFTATMGNSFKCLSKQMVNLADNFQLLTVNTQLQAFAIVGDQFGKEEECSLDRNRRTIPIALGLSTLGLSVIVLVLGLISRRKPNRGYERI
ncbi:lysosome-associated membrane glycoprotein 3 [Emys orbicularis]|uniref:lysosome-associated membrane glycoprotein 3 n=1 Tax=Emys orbicularis TaxID=82168 RepID=UPI0031FC2E4B